MRHHYFVLYDHSCLSIIRVFVYKDIQLRKNLEKEIHNELQTTKNIKKNGRTVGKYDYKTNKLFEELRQLDRLSAENSRLRELVAELDNRISEQEIRIAELQKSRKTEKKQPFGIGSLFSKK